VRVAVVLAVLAVLAAMVQGTSFPASKGGSGRFLVVAKSSADYNALRVKALRGGAKVVRDIPQIGTMVVRGSSSVRSSLQSDSRTKALGTDKTVSINPDAPVSHLNAPGLKSAKRIRARVTVAARSGIKPDPAFSVPGLQWDFPRIGLDFTHSELAPKVTRVVDFTGSEDPPICKTAFGVSDQDLAAQFRSPPTGTATAPGSAATSPRRSTARASTGSPPR
jgi:hypothetical protein